MLGTVIKELEDRAREAERDIHDTIQRKEAMYRELEDADQLIKDKEADLKELNETIFKLRAVL